MERSDAAGETGRHARKILSDGGLKVETCIGNKIDDTILQLLIVTMLGYVRWDYTGAEKVTGLNDVRRV